MEAFKLIEGRVESVVSLKHNFAKLR